MKRATIRRVPYELSIYDSLKLLIPIGVNVRQMSDSEHDLQLRTPPATPESGDLVALHLQVERLATTEGEKLFSVMSLKPDSKRVTLVFKSPERVSINLIRALQKLLSQDNELYLASASFGFGVFIRISEILVWEVE